MAAADGTGPSFLSVTNEALSANIDHVHLGEVMEELSRQLHLKVYVADSVAQEPVSLKFDHLSLEEGIERILAGRRYALTFAPDPASTRRHPLRHVTEIWVFRKSQREAPHKGTPRFLQSLQREAVEAADPSARVKALRALGSRGNIDESLPIFVASLSDDDPLVRQVALEVLHRSRHLPLAAVSDVALRDPSPKLRMAALMVVAEKGEDASWSTLNQALGDQDPKVRDLAREILHEFTAEKVD